MIDLQTGNPKKQVVPCIVCEAELSAVASEVIVINSDDDRMIVGYCCHEKHSEDEIKPRAIEMLLQHLGARDAAAKALDLSKIKVFDPTK